MRTLPRLAGKARPKFGRTCRKKLFLRTTHQRPECNNNVRHINVVEASHESLNGYGDFISDEIHHQIGITYYQHVREGKEYIIKSIEPCTFRCASVSKGSFEVSWLERHQKTNQVRTSIFFSQKAGCRFRD